VPVVADVEEAGWLNGRADGPIDAATVAQLDLARALPLRASSLPHWARYRGRSWLESGHRLVVRAWRPDPAGEGRLQFANLHARNVSKTCAPDDKAAWPTLGPGSAMGVVFSNSVDARAGGLELVDIVEGVPDFLRFAIERSALPAGSRPAVIGVVAGSATAELAAWVPQGSTVALRLHADKAGDSYAERLIELLKPYGHKLMQQRRVNATASRSSVVATALGVAVTPAPTTDELIRRAIDALEQHEGEGAQLALQWIQCRRLFADRGGVPRSVSARKDALVGALIESERAGFEATLAELGGDHDG
jgi:hypothetical protein